MAKEFGVSPNDGEEARCVYAKQHSLSLFGCTAAYTMTQGFKFVFSNLFLSPHHHVSRPPSLALPVPISLPPSLPVLSHLLLSLFFSPSLSHACTHCLSFSLSFYCSRSLFQRVSSDDAHEDAWYAAKIVLPSGRKVPLDELKQPQLTALKAYVNRYALARAY